MLEAILPVCKTLEERLYAQHVIMDRLIVVREGRPYIYTYTPPSPHSSGALMLESFERLKFEGKANARDLAESDTFKSTLAALTAETLREQVNALGRERDRLAREVARLNSSRMLKLGRRIRRALGRPAD
jgi:hypothetical protein